VTALEVGIPGEEGEKFFDPSPGEFKCEVCGKVFKNRIGLAGHRRSHK
jgi:hypothetical protein